MKSNQVSLETRTDLLLLATLCGFLFFYGLGVFGLLGADEPRYAQVAREMLQRQDWVTPTLLGKVWLEKPVLYYWQAMVAFRSVGAVTEAAARVPGGIDAALLVVAIYLFLRRFRPGSEMDGASITATCAGVIGFARAAATDMPLSACFGIALIGWYAWYESRRRVYLAGCYVFLALGTLAKGPVAPALAAVIVLLFLALKRDWRAMVESLWIPGIALYLAVMLPWYAAVQMRNPEFFRVFILEHNLGRFSQDLYHHRQPFWFYLPVLLLAAMPWTIVLTMAVWERARLIVKEGKDAMAGPDDAWPSFLLIWMLVPVVFFSVSQSKLPGYILPAVPAAALLAAEYLFVRRSDGRPMPSWFAPAQGLLCGLLVFGSLAAASWIENHKLVADRETLVAAAVSFALALVMGAVLWSRAGLRLLRPMTMAAVVVGVAAVLRSAGPAIDVAQSARPVAETIQSFSHETVPVALYHVGRVQQYGLEFYLNRATQKYDDGNVPSAAHVVVAAQNSQAEVAQMAAGRRVSYLTRLPAQKLELYWVQ